MMVTGSLGAGWVQDEGHRVQDECRVLDEGHWVQDECRVQGAGRVEDAG